MATCGSSAAQRVRLGRNAGPTGQRGWKRQPGGGLRGSGTPPPTGARDGSAWTCGIESSSVREYGWRGARTARAHDARSTAWPQVHDHDAASHRYPITRQVVGDADVGQARATRAGRAAGSGPPPGPTRPAPTSPRRGSAAAACPPARGRSHPLDLPAAELVRVAVAIWRPSVTRLEQLGDPGCWRSPPPPAPPARHRRPPRQRRPDRLARVQRGNGSWNTICARSLTWRTALPPVRRSRPGRPA